MVWLFLKTCFVLATFRWVFGQSLFANSAFFSQQLVWLFICRNSCALSAKYLACFGLFANSCFFSLFIWRCCSSFLAKFVAGTASGLFLSAAYLVQFLKAYFGRLFHNQLFSKKSCKMSKPFHYCFLWHFLCSAFLFFRCFYSALNIGFQVQNLSRHNCKAKTVPNIACSGFGLRLLVKAIF